MRYNAPLRSIRMQAVIDAIDAAATPAYLEIGDGAATVFGNVLVTIILPNPSFTESAGVITMQGVPLSAQANVNGNAAVARIKDGDGNIVVSELTVGVTGTEIILASVVISPGGMVTLSNGTITHARNT